MFSASVLHVLKFYLGSHIYKLGINTCFVPQITSEFPQALRGAALLNLSFHILLSSATKLKTIESATLIAVKI